MQPVQMTRAEYQAKYGVPPTLPGSQIPQNTTPTPSAPVKMTRAEYQTKYGQGPIDNTQQPNLPNGDGLGSELAVRATDVSNAIGNTLTGKINPVSGLLQSVGGVAGGINDLAGKGIELIPGVKSAEGLIGKGVGKLAETGIGKKIAGGISDFSQKHPELSADIGAVGNIVGAATLFEGGSALKNLAKGGISKALGENVIKEVVADVAPEVGAKIGAKNIAKQGLIKTAITGEIKPVLEKSIQDLGQVVSDNVPGFSKLKTFAEKVNATRDTVYSMADKLKQRVIQSGQDIIYPYKELASELKSLEPSISIKSDSVLQKQFDLAREAALKIAKEKGGTISSLFDARKEFDNLIREQFPNLYDRTNAPMRDAITQMRGAMNDFIEKKLPSGSGFKDSLKIQSKLFNAIDNMAPKAYQEIGSTRLSRFAGRHPFISGLIKKGAQGAAITAGGGSLYGAYKGLTQ